jgi:hypothetical protein
MRQLRPGTASRDHGSCRSLPPDPGRGLRVRAEGSYTLPSRVQPPRPYWSRPFGTDVRSMFARMPRYAPAPLGIRSPAQMRATGQNGSSRHVLALFDSSSIRINEQSSGS